MQWSEPLVVGSVSAAGDGDRFCKLAFRSDDGLITPAEKRELRELVGQINPEAAWELDWKGVMRLVKLTMGIYAIAHADELAAPAECTGRA